jgi:hypothetical protein
LSDIRDRMGEFIASEEATECEPDPALTGFQVVY